MSTLDGAEEPAGQPSVSLWTIVREWTHLGCIGFGGPPTHIALLRRMCVEERGWIGAAEFEDGIAATNLLPGPASTQLAIFCAWRLRGPGGRDHRRALLHRSRPHPYPPALSGVPGPSPG